MENQSAAITPRLVDLLSPVIKQVILDVGIEIVPADAADDVEILIQLDLVRGINSQSR